MRIARNRNSVATLGANAASPVFPLVGNIILTGETEQDEQLIASFVEDVWQHQRGEDFAVAFSPTATDMYLWVSAKTQERVDSVLDWAMGQLSYGFAQQGASVTVVSF